MKVLFPNYKESLVNISNSILKYFEVKPFHDTLELLDIELEKGKYQNVVLIVYDGMGYNLLRRNLDRNMFLNRYLKKSICAVFPPTTTSSTTSIITALTPKEHGWLGWNLYFKEINETVTMFLNTKKDTEEIVSKESIADKYFPYTSIVDRINETYKAYSVMPFGEDKYTDLEDMNRKIIEYCDSKDKKFIYAYSDEPDLTMHQFGTDSKRTRALFQKINDSTNELCKRLKDTLIIVTADHGLINSEAITLSEYKDIFSLLKQDISIEGRACAFFIKDGMKENFERLFHSYFGNDFKLYTKEEVLEQNFFGIGEEHPRFRESLGDYLAIAISNKYFRYDENSNNPIAMHAGITEDEVLVPLIIYKTK